VQCCWHGSICSLLPVKAPSTRSVPVGEGDRRSTGQSNGVRPSPGGADVDAMLTLADGSRSSCFGKNTENSTCSQATSSEMHADDTVLFTDFK